MLLYLSYIDVFSNLILNFSSNFYYNYCIFWMSTFQSIVSFLDEDVLKFIDWLFRIWSDLERFINSEIFLWKSFDYLKFCKIIVLRQMNYFWIWWVIRLCLLERRRLVSLIDWFWIVRIGFLVRNLMCFKIFLNNFGKSAYFLGILTKV